jgi:hypothetical protein
MLLNKFFFAPPDTTLETGGADLSINDMIDEMAKEDPKDDKETDLLAKDKEIPEKEEELELEKETPDDEEEEPKEIDELESVEEFSRKNFLKEYPDAFKKFPQLEVAFYREKKYAEMFPTIDDAKEAHEKVQNYNRFESSLLSGDLDTVLSSVKSSDEKAYNKMVDNYLPALGKVDQGAYYHVINTVLKNTIVAMIREGDNIKNDDLKAAGVILNQFITGKSDFVAPTNFGPHKTTEQPDNEQTQYLTDRLESTIQDLTTRSQNIIKSTISKHIDPKGVMTDYVKRTAIKDAMEEVDTLIGKDTRFTAIKDRLWQTAIKNKFGKEHLSNIEKAYLNKAKTLLQQVIQKHRNEALRGLGKRVNDEKEEPTKKGLISVGRNAGGRETSNKEEVVPKGMRTLDFLMKD